MTEEAVSEEVVLVEKKDFICTVTINRPDKRNALTTEVMYRLGDALGAVNDDSEVRVVVLRGAGEKAFCAGLDLRGGIQLSEGEKMQKGDPLEYARGSIMACTKPVIAMIYRNALGAGCDLATACDIRVASDTARMGINPVKLGGVYWPQAIQNMVNVVGLAWAKQLYFTGRFIDAETAKEMGLVNYVVPEEELPTKAYALAQEIAENGPLAVSATKAIFNKLLKYQEISAEDMAEIQALRDSVSRSEDFSEGMLAFMQKRKADFKGK
jgi:enoyl-CoA hydratase/carnithine racemase